jgi:hypothetical protein
VGSGPDHDGDRGLERVQVMLLEILTKKLIGDAEFDAGVTCVKDAQRTDPGVQDLRGKLAVEGTEKPVEKVVAHEGPS